MDQRVKHPRLLAAARVGLHLVAVVAALALLGSTLAFLGVMAILGALFALFGGGADAAVVVSVGGVGMLLTVIAVTALAVGVRRTDRMLTHAARRPNPLDTVARRYVVGDIDERELERQIERVLAGKPVEGARPSRRPTAGSLRHATTSPRGVDAATATDRRSLALAPNGSAVRSRRSAGSERGDGGRGPAP